MRHVRTLSLDRIGGTAGNLHFVVTRSVVSASMDMGVGHSGIVNLLCRYLDMNAIIQTTYVTLKSVVAETACNVWTMLLRSYVVCTLRLTNP